MAGLTRVSCGLGKARTASTRRWYDIVTQYSVPQVLAAWAATVVPMSLLAGVVTPWLSHRLGGRDPFISALMICFLVGLVWQLVLAHAAGPARAGKSATLARVRRPVTTQADRP